MKFVFADGTSFSRVSSSVRRETDCDVRLFTLAAAPAGGLGRWHSWQPGRLVGGPPRGAWQMLHTKKSFMSFVLVAQMPMVLIT